MDDAFLEKEPQDLIYTYWRDWLPDQPGKITQKGIRLYSWNGPVSI